ncbi:monooxygenase [Acrocarpospora pleiomorpha]|uniref:Monooxygenase n=1 Tax=Acrocarpospora pleiomorpha TaxID=90975 RepID=A0A5M3X8B0_9ACTN|nr:LLM class flavin-dependent oxidoreductase [Acrocarpospora pleiomorpha]GES17344.1 monooxygenase [Acrocarpospora pleiomorpha]
MTKNREQLHLNLFPMGVGHHEAAWRHPVSTPARILDPRYYHELAQLAERGLFDSIFFGDILALGHRIKHNVHTVLEPITLLSSISAVTERVGLIGTASTTFNLPYNLARMFASLDHLSSGRAGWNIVTSSADPLEAQNFGLEVNVDHAERYEVATEFVDVVVGLWNSWEPDALVMDKASGVFADPAKVRSLDHQGKHFRVRGPLNVPRSPQGSPLLVQAGSSPAGRTLAASRAHAIFTAQQSMEESREFRLDIHRRAAAFGRRPAEVTILPGLVPIVAPTVAEAQELVRELNELIVVDYALAQLSVQLEVDLIGSELDAKVPPLPDVEHVRGNRSRFVMLRDLIEAERPTVRELITRIGGLRGHGVVVGTPQMIADHMHTWFEEGAADGFNLLGALQPTIVESFVKEVVPLLQDRGIFRTEYATSTLRGHYGADSSARQAVRG